MGFNPRRLQPLLVERRGRMRTIYINGKFYGQPITGTQRYARELTAEFDKLLSEEPYKDIAIEVLVPNSVREIPEYVNLRVRRVGRGSGTIWEQLELPRYCRGGLLLTTSGGAPLLYARNVITIHDASVYAMPEGYSLAYRIWYQLLYRSMARRAVRVLTVSSFSKSEIVRWCGGRPENIVVTHLGSEHFCRLESDATTLERMGISGKFVLAASSHKPNKNFDRTAKAFEQLALSDVQFVIAGGRDAKVYGAGSALSAAVRDVGYVSDRELKALYEGASCFVFASLYEGFGLPPLEAMSCGCPVVVARAASLPELFEGKAIFCDPYSPDEIAAAIDRTLKAPAITAEESQAFAKSFSWRRCAEQTLDVLLSL